MIRETAAETSAAPVPSGSGLAYDSGLTTRSGSNRGLGEHVLFPLVWREVAAGFSNGLERGLGKIAQGSGAPLGRRVNVVVASVRQDLLGYGGGDDTSTSRCWDQAHMD